jgi:hypothetical protein
MNESVLKLPNETKFLRFKRISLKYNQFIVKRAINAFRKVDLVKFPNYDENYGKFSTVLTNYITDFPEKSDRSTRIINNEV